MTKLLNTVQSHLFSFLWKNKKDKIKRNVAFQPLSEGGLNFINFRVMVKSLRLAWISRLLSNSNDNWKAIPNFYFEKYGGLLSLLKCNYNTANLDKNLPLFYRKLLEYFRELNNNSKDNNSDLILWNNKKVTVEKNSVSSKHWFERGIYFVSDLSNSDGKFLSLDEFQKKYDLEVNFLHYFHLLVAIPSDLNRKAFDSPTPDLFSTSLEYHQLEDRTLVLPKLRCKNYHKLFIEKLAVEPTAFKTSKRYFPELTDWNKCLVKCINHLRITNLDNFLLKSCTG